MPRAIAVSSCLVHQGRGLERLTRRLAGQLLSGQAAQLVVDQREQLAGRLPLPRPRASRMRVTSPSLPSIGTSSTSVDGWVRQASESRPGVTRPHPRQGTDGRSPRSYPVGRRNVTRRMSSAHLGYLVRAQFGGCPRSSLLKLVAGPLHQPGDEAPRRWPLPSYLSCRGQTQVGQLVGKLAVLSPAA